MRNVLKAMKVVKVDNGHVAAQTLITSSTIDASGFNSALVIADFGTLTDGSILTLNLQDGSDSGGSGAATIASTDAFTAATSSNGQIVLDVQRFQGRYLTVTLSRTAQNAVVNSITIILYTANNVPTSQPTTVLSNKEVIAAA